MEQSSRCTKLIPNLICFTFCILYFCFQIFIHCVKSEFIWVFCTFQNLKLYRFHIFLSKIDIFSCNLLKFCHSLWFYFNIYKYCYWLVSWFSACFLYYLIFLANFNFIFATISNGKHLANLYLFPFFNSSFIKALIIPMNSNKSISMPIIKLKDIFWPHWLQPFIALLSKSINTIILTRNNNNITLIHNIGRNEIIKAFWRLVGVEHFSKCYGCSWWVYYYSVKASEGTVFVCF